MRVKAVSSKMVRSSRVRRRSRLTTDCSVPWLRDQHLLQGLELLDALTCTHGNGVEGVVGDEYRHAGLVLQPFVETTQQRAATGQHDAAVHHIAGQLRRALVERCL